MDRNMNPSKVRFAASMSTHFMVGLGDWQIVVGKATWPSPTRVEPSVLLLKTDLIKSDP